METLRICKNLFPWTKVAEQKDDELRTAETFTKNELGLYCYIVFRVGANNELDLFPRFVLDDLISGRLSDVNVMLKSVQEKSQRFGWGTKIEQFDRYRPRSKTPIVSLRAVYQEAGEGQYYETLTAKEYFALEDEFGGKRGGCLNALWIYMAMKSHMLSTMNKGQRVYGGKMSAKVISKWTGFTDRTCINFIGVFVRMGLLVKAGGATGSSCTYALGDNRANLSVIEDYMERKRQKEENNYKE